MAEKWYAVYEEATGRLHATGTVVADAETLAKNGMVAKECVGFNPQEEAPNGDRWEWDASSRKHLPVSPTTRKQRELAFHEAEALRLKGELGVL